MSVHDFTNGLNGLPVRRVFTHQEYGDFGNGPDSFANADEGGFIKIIVDEGKVVFPRATKAGCVLAAVNVRDLVAFGGQNGSKSAAKNQIVRHN
jgi:hypothetical protein